ncbi:MAG: TetR family transcriptional regulator C-terminal domain-containing protein [Nocardioidaceae bacterium]|nr:TetR family transcriptional regulator C-terminal domain-containing protein [Nocardioidaceae bacterium]
MPKIVDHDARRAELAAAMRRVILRDGVEAASVRGVAAEAGWSAGALRHYFPDQAALLRFAVSLMLAEVPVRTARHLHGGAWTVDDAQALLEEVLPLDDVRRFEMRVWLATTDRARHDPGFDEVRELAWAGIERICRVALARLLGLPPADPSRPLADPRAELEVARTQALVDGLALEAIHYPERMTPDRLRRVLRAHLDALVT